MNNMHRTSCRLAAGLAIGLAALPAQADGTFGETILNVTGFRVLHSDGTQVLQSDFAGLINNNVATVPGMSTYYGGGNIDLGPGCSGPAGFTCDPVYPNWFEPYREDAYHFRGGYAYVNGDQRQQGALFPESPSALNISTRGDIGVGAYGPSHYEGVARQFMQSSFQLTSSDTMTFVFDAQPFAKVRGFASPDGPPTALIQFNLSLRDLTTGALVFTFAPDALNFTLSSGNGTLLLRDPGTLHFSATTDVLSASDHYELDLDQRTYSLANVTSVPEPASPAMLLAGLGLLALWRRRRA